MIAVTAASLAMSSGVVADLLGGLRSFVSKRVVTLHDEYADLLDDPRSLYALGGQYAPAVVELMRQVRQESASAGYYTMFAPEEVGGGGLGAVAWYEVWEMLHHAC